ncbi:MAG TPA: FG-GAP-like repeat-containing protein [Thermoanaerobaculia bacterium]|nr:FG-GAP-like repeat-containing protein [Thermoanaerobaculia bacterium]
MLALPLLLAALSAGASAVPSASDLAALQAARNVGLAALEEGRLEEASKSFETVRRHAPDEPLGWANGAIAAARAKDFASAEKLLTEALRLAPGDARILAIDGAVLEAAGDRAAAVAAYEKAAAASPRDVASRWAAARVRIEAGDPASRAAALRDVEAALERAPANAFLLLRAVELARGQGDTARALAASDRLAALVAGDPKLDTSLADGRRALQAGDDHTASLRYRVAENILRTMPRYQQARHDVEPGVLGLPLEDWSPVFAAAMRSKAASPVPVTFVARPDAALASLTGSAVVRVAGKDARELAIAGASGVRVAAPTHDGYRLGPALPGSAATDLAVADVANTGSLDLVTPGALWLREGEGYRRVEIAAGERIVPFDYDADGDLDLYVSSKSGDRLLRNNLDGTWTDVTEASGIAPGTRSVLAVAADFDRDGDVDLLLARTEGGFVLYDNLRGGRLAPKEAGLPKTGAITAAAAGDVDGDGRLDLVWVADGRAFVARNRGDGTFLPGEAVGSAASILLFDYDNDGFLDLFLANPAGASVLLRNDGAGRFSPAPVGTLPSAREAEAVDFDGDGDLDLAIVTPGGTVALLENRGGNANGWLDVALEGLPTGSAKVNRLGYGSEIEAKAQDLYVYRVVSRPVTRLGLGARRRADVLRVVWTNGVPQNALDPPARTVVREVQQLKGSCPFLYAFDGGRWSFVTDVLGRAPAGLLYDGRHQAPADTREWLIVPGSSLAPAGRELTLDFTEELWETAYFDLARLFAADHPAGTALVTNEKMVPPPFPEKKIFTAAKPYTPRAADESGRDRTAEIASEDGVFLAGFAPTAYQGIVAPHELVLELPEARRTGTVMLYLTGWIFYADTSINVSLSQRRDLSAAPPALDVPDGRGGWKVAVASRGYPAGKTKTMPIDLTSVLDRSDPRIRIRTNLAIYWDRIAYTVDDPAVPVTLSPAPLRHAELFFRGFSRMRRASPEGPQVFDHDDVSQEPRWADMAGLYTRFGDVTDLLTEADDRYVVMKGGDAVRLRFDASALPPLTPGWVRDYLVVLDGWDKDADKNTVAGQTVEPLPFHGMDDARYGELAFPPSAAHDAFAATYLTRPGGPDEFRDAVRRGAGPASAPSP